MSETSSIQTKRNRKHNCTVKPIKQVRQFTFFKVKNENLREAVFRIPGDWHVGWWNLITRVRLIQVGNDRNDYFRSFLGVLVRLIKVPFKVNKGNKFGDFGYCPLNRGCSLNTVSA